MNKQKDFISKRRLCLIISACIMVVGLAMTLIFGVEMDVTFKGGTLLKYSYTGDMNASDLSSFFTAQIGESATAELSQSGDIQLINVYSTAVVESDQQVEIDKAFAEKYPDNEISLVNSNSITSKVGSLFFVKCLVATALACLFLVLFIALRFSKIGGWTAGLAAVAALAHDLLIVFFTFVIFRIPLNDNFVAVMLTILGYSLNDTIVIFDRIRENRSVLGAKANVNDVVNLSLNQSFNRTMNTSITTGIVVLTLVVVAFAWNLDSIISFALPMLFGVASGFYSSVFLCSPLWAAWTNRRLAKKEAK
ncbi:MAG: protein translocase subunit SecF [Ruminococcaceae bacterium]|nr:protein translocase subunit SecF [Oscillospiraceae bacterium]